jgi:2-haloacid dehalogenase
MLKRGDSLMDFRGFEVVSFDCYGTLIDWESGIVSGLRPVLSNHGVDATDDEILDLHARTEYRLQSSSMRGHYTTYRDVLGEEVREAGTRWGFEPRPSELDALADSLRDWQPFPDTVEALRTLKERYKLAIISNVDDGLFALTACHLEVEFDWIITAEQAGTYKPSPNNFELTLERLGCHQRGSCMPPRVSSTTTFPRRSWACPPFGCTGGRRKEGLGRPRQRTPNPTSRSRT